MTLRRNAGGIPDIGGVLKSIAWRCARLGSPARLSRTGPPDASLLDARGLSSTGWVEAVKRGILLIMTRSLSAVAIGLLLLSSVAACTDSQGVNAATGAVVGGAIGNQFGSGQGKTAMTAAGAATGAAVGANVR
jgi:hypothetical protein